MIKKNHVVLLACGLALASAPAVLAQTPDEPARGYVSISGGFQTAARTITEAGGFTLYDEPGSFTGLRKTGNGAFFEFGGGAHVFDKVSAGIAVSIFSKSSNVPFTVTAPHPLFFDTPRTATLNATGLHHRETAVHLQAIYQLFSSSKYDASIVAGPSIFSVKRDQLADVTASETGTPFTTVNLSSSLNSASKTAVGGNVGLDVSYHLTGGIAAGFLVRYSGATAKLPSGKVKVGGPQVGFGLRYRF